MKDVARFVAPAESVVQDPPLGTGDAVRTALDALDSDNAKGEYYLTDIVRIARRKGLLCRALELPAEELLGINTRAELAEAEALMQRRLRRAAMDSGVTLVAPETVFLSVDTQLGRDAVIEPNVVLGPGVTVGEGARICSFSHLED